MPDDPNWAARQRGRDLVACGAPPRPGAAWREFGERLAQLAAQRVMVGELVGTDGTRSLTMPHQGYWDDKQMPWEPEPLDWLARLRAMFLPTKEAVDPLVAWINWVDNQSWSLCPDLVGGLHVENRGAIWWYYAPKPPEGHQCRAWTRAWGWAGLDDPLTEIRVYRCACGSYSQDDITYVGGPS